MAVVALNHPQAIAEDRDDQRVEAAKHDPTAFAPLYEDYFSSVYGYCLRMLRDTQLAADATSECFLKAIRALPGYRARSFRAWLFTIAHNVAIDMVRANKAVVDIDATVAFADPDPSPEERLLARESDARVREMIGRLSPNQAHIIELRIAGLTTREIADVLDCSTGAVRIAQFRALSRLRQLLSDPKPEQTEDVNRAH